jgi:hypothetical protein
MEKMAGLKRSQRQPANPRSHIVRLASPPWCPLSSFRKKVSSSWNLVVILSTVQPCTWRVHVRWIGHLSRVRACACACNSRASTKQRRTKATTRGLSVPPINQSPSFSVSAAVLLAVPSSFRDNTAASPVSATALSGSPRLPVFTFKLCA